MESSSRSEMQQSLKERVIPVLREKGFKGYFPHFRRIVGGQVHLLTFQFDKWGGGFVIEIAHCAAEGFTNSWGSG